MAARLVLTCEEGSALFSEKVLTLVEGEKVTVTRAVGEDSPAQDNAVFDSKVLSRAHAVFSFVNGQFFLKDVGSRNGTFINSFRLSKQMAESDDICLYSQDIIRFGNQVKDNSKCITERCILARINVYFPIENKLCSRPEEDRFYNPTLGNIDTKKVRKHKTKNDISANDEDNKETREDNTIPLDIMELKESLEMREEQHKKLSDEHASMLQQNNDKISELENLLNEKENMLQRSLDENVQLQKQIDNQNECIHQKNMDIDNLSNTINEIQTEVQVENKMNIDKNAAHDEDVKRFNEKMDIEKKEKEKLKESLTTTNDSLKAKETEIEQLKQLLAKDITNLKEKAGAYQELENLVTEEDATLQEAEEEMKCLLDIIAENQEIILRKEKRIITLQNILKEKDELLEKERNGMSKQGMEAVFAKNLETKALEISDLRNNLKSLEKFNMEKNQKVLDLNEKIDALEEQLRTHKDLKMKCENLMEIIMKQNSEQDSLETEIAGNHGKIEKMEKELLVLKGVIQIQNRASSLKQDYQETIENLQQKIINEQLINEQSENEIIKLRLEIDTLHQEIDINAGKYNLLKDEEILNLKIELLKEQKVTTNIQVAQEKELMEKEKEIWKLSQILEEERKVSEKVQSPDIQSESVAESIDTNTSATLLNDESATLVNETVTIKDGFSDEEEDFALLEDLEIDSKPDNLDDVSLG